MPTTGNLFAVLFPTEAEQMAEVAARVGAPLTAPVPGHPVATANASGTTTVVEGGTVVTPLVSTTPVPTAPTAASAISWAVPPTPAALATLYLAAQQPGTVTWENIADPVTVPAQQTVTRRYPATPLGASAEVWVPLEPITVQARTHTPTLQVATLTIDGLVLLTDYPLVHDAEVLSQAHAVVQNQITVTLTNAGWQDVQVAIIVTAASLRRSVYQTEVAPALRAAAAALRQGPPRS